MDWGGTDATLSLTIAREWRQSLPIPQAFIYFNKTSFLTSLLPAKVT